MIREEVPEGPLEHAIRASSERDYVDGLSEGGRMAFARASGGHPEVVPKRLLVSISHAIERAVMSTMIESPTVVVALFQRLRFFDRERAVYERMAQRGVHVVIGFVEGEGHEPPPGVHTVLLDPNEPLADEWTVVAVGPAAGAFLVATDQHRFDASERNVEMSRQFAGRWGFSRNQTASELARLRMALGDRLAPGVRQVVDELLATAMPVGGHSAASAGTTGEVWATTTLYHLLERMHAAQTGTRELRHQLAEAHLAAAARAAGQHDPDSGLPTAEFLTRWAERSEDTELAVGLALFDFPELGADAIQGDERAAYYASRHVAAALSQPLGPVDIAVRVSSSEFLLVIPGASPRHLAGLCDRVGEQLVLASQGYPHIHLSANTATIVTKSRPLPVRDLRVALEHLQTDDAGPLRVGRTPAGESITVASSALYEAAEQPLAGAGGVESAGGVAAASTPAPRSAHAEATSPEAGGWWDTAHPEPGTQDAMSAAGQDAVGHLPDAYRTGA